MHPNSYYHILAQGNKDQLIFFKEHNYKYIISKIERSIVPHTHILCYCLLPNRLHILLCTKNDFNPRHFSQQLGIFLSSYTKALQKQENFVGSLFRQNTKQTLLITESEIIARFYAIHNLPVLSHLVEDPQDWPHSSFNEYYHHNHQICDTEFTRDALKINQKGSQFLKQTLLRLPPKISR